MIELEDKAFNYEDIKLKNHEQNIMVVKLSDAIEYNKELIEENEILNSQLKTALEILNRNQ